MSTPATVVEVQSWVDFKALCGPSRKNLSNQFGDYPDRYELYGPDAVGILWHTTVIKTSPRNSDQIDFEDNCKASYNWAVGSRAYAFATGDFEFQGDGVFETAGLLETTKNLDYQAPKSLYANGGMALVRGSILGDYIVAQVIDRDGLIPEPYRVAYPNYPVLKQWVNKWYLPEVPAGNRTDPVLIQTPYAGVIPAGMVMRVILHKESGHEVALAINYFLHEAI